MGALNLSSWPGLHATAGVVGSKDPDGRRPVVLERAGDTTRSLPWASVSKLLVTVAVLVAVEEGTLFLDEPAGPPGATVRHLLAHVSGLPLGLDENAEARRRFPAPGTRRIYSNVGFEILADLLAQRAGMPYPTYLRHGVLDPLGMDATELPERASPASGIHGPLEDLLRLGAELLSPRLVDPSTLKNARQVAFPGLAGVLPGFGRFAPCDWGLGFEIRDAKTPHWTGSGNSPETFGHFGQSGSFLWVDPQAGLACGALGDTPFGPWAREAWPVLSDAVLAAWASC
jgi:CubicO group peptidase (beta-lactamase class C family)